MATQKIKTLKEMILSRADLKNSGKKLVFTNGCFDILHLGHVRYLNQARALGDALVVAVNSDRSTRNIKGPSRPIVPEAERAEILAALSCVDYVIIFDETTPKEVISSIIPDVLVKGADWSIDEIVGRDTVESSGGVVLSIPLVEGASTTEIIRKVLERFENSNRS
jgi:D-beta-D-heptose 7-phosphate kinase/D-beta-D-heptose 1-phosphate adenosyltransferase